MLSFSEFRFKNLAPYHGIAQSVAVENFQSRSVTGRLRGPRQIARDAFTLGRKGGGTDRFRLRHFRSPSGCRCCGSRGGSALGLSRSFGLLHLRALFGFFIFISKKSQQ